MLLGIGIRGIDACIPAGGLRQRTERGNDDPATCGHRLDHGKAGSFREYARINEKMYAPQCSSDLWVRRETVIDDPAHGLRPLVKMLVGSVILQVKFHRRPDMQFGICRVETLPGIEQYGKAAKGRACIRTTPSPAHFPAPQIRACIQRMPEHDALLRREPERLEILLPLPIGYENKAIDRADELCVFAPLNPTLVHVVVH